MRASRVVGCSSMKKRSAAKRISFRRKTPGKGVLITFEGVEATGKSTQISLVAKRLKKEGYSVYCSKEPGGGPLAKHIRSLLLNPKMRGLDPLAELFLYEASRAQHMQESILPELKKGKVVLCDRYIDSSWVYQGLARKLDLNLVDKLNSYATANLKPKLTLVFQLPLNTSLKRLNARKKKDRMEQEKIGFHKAIHRGYTRLPKEKNKENRFVKIDARKSKEQILEDIWKALKDKKVIL